MRRAVMTSDLNAQGAPSFATLIERVKPAVVSVKVKIANASSEDNGVQMDNLPPEIQQFLKRFGGAGGMNGGMQQKSQPMIGEGSGFFVSADGYIVTNNHVVQNAKTVSVTMDNGKTLDAKVVGADPKTDVAVIKVNEPGDYPFVSFAKEMPRIGDWVVAIGNPYGLGGTVTAGIVSAEGRDIGDGPYDRFLQIDAPINRGNSGGPTFNMQGQVVGDEHRDLLALRRQRRHRLRHSGLDREHRRGGARAWRQHRPRLSRGRNPAGKPGYRREPRAQVRRRRDR